MQECCLPFLFVYSKWEKLETVHKEKYMRKKTLAFEVLSANEATVYVLVGKCNRTSFLEIEIEDFSVYCVQIRALKLSLHFPKKSRQRKFVRGI